MDWDHFWTSFAASLPSMLGALAAAWLAFEAKLQSKNTAAKVKADLTRSDSATNAKLNDTLKTVQIVHALVNSSMHLALESNAKLARKVYEMERTDENKAIAEEADRALADHDSKQREADKSLSRPIDARFVDRPATGK